MRCFSKNAALSLVAFLLVVLKAGHAQHLRVGDTKATEGTCACVCAGGFAFPLSGVGW